MSVRMIAAILALWALGGGGAAAQTTIGTSNVTLFPPSGPFAPIGTTIPNESQCAGTPSNPSGLASGATSGAGVAHYLTWYGSFANGTLNIGSLAQPGCSTGQNVLANAMSNIGASCKAGQVLVYDGSNYVCKTGYFVAAYNISGSTGWTDQYLNTTNNISCPSGLTMSNTSGTCYVQWQNNNQSGTNTYNIGCNQTGSSCTASCTTGPVYFRLMMVNASATCSAPAGNIVWDSN